MARARVPGSSANLGPGFDTLALAFALYTEVDIEPADELTLETTGEGADLTARLRDPGDHLAAKVARKVLGHDRVRIRVHSDIPVSRGLGSSAALAAAAASAAGAPSPFTVASAFEGHPENAAASVFGGLVAATMVDDRTPVAARLPLDPDLAFVVVVPDRELATKTARGALPEQVAHHDASFNLGRLALLIAGLGDRTVLRGEAMDDRLHQPHRAGLYPEAAPLMAALRDGGAVAACWSGAGPTLLAVTSKGDAERVREAGEQALVSQALPGRSLVVSPDLHGLTVG